MRDACVFREDIDIYDTMTAAILYENGVQVSYSLNAYMPIEGYHLAFNGTEGRIEVRMYEKQAFDAPDGPRRDPGARHRPLGGAHLGRARAGRAFRRRPAAAPEPLRAGDRRSAEPAGRRAGRGDVGADRRRRDAERRDRAAGRDRAAAARALGRIFTLVSNGLTLRRGAGKWRQRAKVYGDFLRMEAVWIGMKSVVAFGEKGLKG